MKNLEKSNTTFFTALAGCLVLLLFFSDVLFRKLGIGVLFVFLFVLITLVFTLILSFRLKNKLLIVVNGLFLLLIITLPFFHKNRLFEAEPIFEAQLKEERLGLNFRLYKDETFRIRATHLVGFDDFVGNYSIFEDKIILHSSPDNTMFFSDTLRIWENHLIINKLSEAPDTSLYDFNILKNEL